MIIELTKEELGILILGLKNIRNAYMSPRVSSLIQNLFERLGEVHDNDKETD